ncbi:hypothetical protein SKAU_G00245080 [Synaphobranchus kaupii]|uniref:L1 transposable element RRM domain-containing protein n=1 Tax=Synaphobranchus kaupii TaxID=118154 RepID=A0A9Q1F1R7_SYNKA|nr:hypothetical protein SKAU_G00245080 [Synaphobranchus kaupii]
MPNIRLTPDRDEDTSNGCGKADNAGQTTAGYNPSESMAEDIAGIRQLLIQMQADQENKLNKIKKTTSSIKGKLTDVLEHLDNVEKRLDFLEDSAKKAAAKPSATHSEVKRLCQKVDDQENRARRNNLRFTGFPNHCEGKDALSLLERTIPEMLGIDFPRDVICVRGAASEKKDVRWQGHRISIYPDYSKEVQIQRQRFRKCREKLHERKVKFALLYPAVLKIDTRDGQHKFDDPKEAQQFIDSM